MTKLLTIDELSDRERQRGLITLMCSSFLSWGGFFMIIPLVAVHYVDHLGWAAGTIGIILAIRQFTQQGLTTIFGVLADRIGPKILISIGMFLRSVGFVAMGFAETFATVLGAAIIVALGGAMFDSPISAAIAALTHPEERRRYYARLGMISGIGTTVGTQIGAILIGYDFKRVCLGGAAFFFIAALGVTIALPPVAASVGEGSATAGVRQVLADKLFLRYVAIVAGYWFAWTQFGLTITLAAVEITGSDRAVSWIYLVNAVVTVALGYVLPRFLERWLPPLQLQIAGVITIGLGLMAVGFASGFNGVLVAVAIFAIGAVMARPGQETVMANLAHPSARGTYFGIASIALAVGGGLGNYFGGVIYDVGGGAESPLPWIIFGGVALITSALLWVNRVRFSVVRA